MTSHHSKKEGVKHSPSSKWCIIRYNRSLRTAVKLQMEKRGVTAKAVSKASGLPYVRLTRYLRNEKRGWLTQYQVLQLCDHLGIDVSLNVKINES